MTLSVAQVMTSPGRLFQLRRSRKDPVALLGEGGGEGPTRVTPSREVTPGGKKLWANLQRIVDKRGRTGKKGAGDTHPSEINKSDGDK